MNCGHKPSSVVNILVFFDLECLVLIYSFSINYTSTKLIFQIYFHILGMLRHCFPRLSSINRCSYDNLFITSVKLNHKKMKNSNTISIGIIMLLTLSLFTSCDKEEFDIIELVSETVTNPDTIVTNEGLVFRVEENEATNFNGISVFCPNNDPSKDNFINVIAYGKDLVVSEDGQDATYEDDLFIFFWESDQEVSAGTYQALVTIEDDDTARETIAEVTITEVTEAFTTGTFKGKYLADDFESVVNFSGSFSVSRFDCALFGDDLPSPDDFEPEISFGQTMLDFGPNNQEELSSLYLNCTVIFPELEGNKHIQIMAEAVAIFDGEVDEIILPRYFAYHRETEELELNRAYEGRFGAAEEDDEPFSMGEAELINISQPITITYTEIDENFITGEYLGQFNGQELKGTFRSQIFECD